MPESKTSLRQMLHDIRRIEENRKILTEEKIQAIYRTLEDDLNAFIAKEYRKYADENGQLYMSYLDSKRQRAKFLQEIVENVDNITPELKKTLTSLVNKTYEECYKGMAETVTQAATAENIAEVGKSLSVRPETLKRAVDNNISKLTLPQVLQKHRAEIIYQIQQELNIGLINGDRYERMANRISERVGVSMSKARNIVRTESHRNVESGMMDCAENIDKKLDGSDLIYAATWKTMKDSRVRPQVMRRTKHGWKHGYSKNGADHMKMEGVTVRVGELFDLGNGVKAKAPGLSGVAAHDCNCRCYLDYNLMTVEEFAKATGKSVEEIRNKYSMEISTGNRHQLIENIRSKQIWQGIGESERDYIVDYLKDGDENTLTLINNTIDKVSVEWLRESGTSHYRPGTGNITMYSEDSNNKLAQTFWHEYGHFVDDDDVSGAGIKYIETFTNKRTGKVRTFEYNGTSFKAEKIGYKEASEKDVNKLLKDAGLSDKYYAQASDEYGYGGCWIHRKSDDSFIDVESSYSEMDELSKAMGKIFDDVSGLTKARNYLKDMGYPDDPNWDDYFETYYTPKRGIAKTREKYKGAEKEYQKAIDDAADAKAKFESTHDMETLKNEQNTLIEKAYYAKEKFGWVSDTIDGSCCGAFLSNISLGGHSASYYQTDNHGLREGVANVFMANATGDKDVVKAMKEICPEIYKVLTEAWKVGK